jgi:hypothetical protein
MNASDVLLATIVIGVIITVVGNFISDVLIVFLPKEIRLMIVFFGIVIGTLIYVPDTLPWMIITIVVSTGVYQFLKNLTKKEVNKSQYRTFRRKKTNDFINRLFDRRR